MKTIQEEAKEYTIKQISDLGIEYTDKLCRDTDIKVSVNDFKAGVQFAQRWISVEEEIPPLSGSYLCSLVNDR